MHIHRSYLFDSNQLVITVHTRINLMERMFRQYLSTSHFFLVLTIFMFLILGYYPFHWEIPYNFKLSTDKRFVTYDAKRLFGIDNTNVEYSDTELNLSKPGIAYLPIPPGWIQEVISDSSLILELSIQTSLLQQFGPARIFTISKDPKYRNITVAQGGSDLILRLRTIDSGLNGLPQYVVKNVFINSNKLSFLIKITNRELEIFVNGVKRLTTNLPQDALSNWNTDYKLALGNELTFDRPWIGKIYKAAISTNTRSIDYIKNNTLQIPHTYTVTHNTSKQIYLSIFGYAGSVYNRLYDYVINFFGFFMFGILLRFLSNKKVSYKHLIAVCVFLSLSIEIGQLFLTRNTSIHDFVLNSAGGLCGILFTRFMDTIAGVNKN